MINSYIYLFSTPIFIFTLSGVDAIPTHLAPFQEDISFSPFDFNEEPGAGIQAPHIKPVKISEAPAPAPVNGITIAISVHNETLTDSSPIFLNSIKDPESRVKEGVLPTALVIPYINPDTSEIPNAPKETFATITPPPFNSTPTLTPGLPHPVIPLGVKVVFILFMIILLVTRAGYCIYILIQRSCNNKNNKTPTVNSGLVYPEVHSELDIQCAGSWGASRRREMEKEGAAEGFPEPRMPVRPGAVVIALRQYPSTTKLENYF
ncbi:hypothetical protein FPQ18DRAFT_306402 [Pyronema domesticum]|nr:hypothetical protein FPQ18DRAFT_306402 [Pyronema domesticum]